MARKTSALKMLAEQIFSRTSGSPLYEGNTVRILKDAKENYPAWISAINNAKRYVHFESYIINDDPVGLEFADLLASKARQGVKVKVVYDWIGAFGTSRRFWNSLRSAGVEVRCFNPPRIDSPLAWLTRDHRKMVSVDGVVGFVAGLCVGHNWVGRPERGVPPWRDTGIEIRGPAVADIDLAFGQIWETMGNALPPDELTDAADITETGDVALRVVASIPNAAGVYRLDQLIAALASNYLWLSDAYFLGASTYIQALRSAALDGVDVRILVPGTTDIPIFRAVSKMGFYPLLEAGVRVFEWNGPMMHAKTAVTDQRWARVGSTNLNLASWIGNYELDVAIEDRTTARIMEEMFLEDISQSTEIVLNAGEVRPLRPRPRWTIRKRKRGTGSVGRAGAGAIRIGSAVGAAITNHRVLARTESGFMFAAGLLLIGFGVLSLVWPRWAVLPLSFLGMWLGISLVIRAYKLRYEKRKGKAASPSISQY